MQSRTLHGSESLRGFLRFVVVKALDEPGTQVKEYTIATEVFGRDGNYDPRIDSMVRVQAGRLRSKVQEYYATEGRNDPIVIDLPKGHYTPVFNYHSIEDPGAALAAPTVPSERHSELLAHAATRQKLLWLVYVLGAVCLILVSLVVHSYQLPPTQEERTGPAARTGDELQAISSFWGDILRSPEPVLVAFSNTRFLGTAESGMKLLKPLDASPQGSGTTAESAAVVTEHYTGVGEVMGVHFLSELFGKAGRPFRVKRSLLLTWDDLKSENFVFLGSPAENLLLRDLPQEQDFVFGLVGKGVSHQAWGILNRKPQPGEEQHYLARQDGPSRSQISEDYALISMLNGLDAKHRLLVLAGITTYGTQAAAEFVTKPDNLKELMSRLQPPQSVAVSPLPGKFQVLLKVKVNGSVPVQISYMTHHVLR